MLHISHEQVSTGKVSRLYNVSSQFLCWTQELTMISVIWGMGCMCLAAPTNYAGFVATRFMLGFLEGAVCPAFVTLTSIWYRKDEHALRIG